MDYGYVNYISTIYLVLLADVSVNTNWKGAFISRTTNEINNHTHKNETLSEKAFSYLFRYAFLRETYETLMLRANISKLKKLRLLKSQLNTSKIISQEKSSNTAIIMYVTLALENLDLKNFPTIITYS